MYMMKTHPHRLVLAEELLSVLKESIIDKKDLPHVKTLEMSSLDFLVELKFKTPLHQ